MSWSILLLFASTKMGLMHLPTPGVLLYFMALPSLHPSTFELKCWITLHVVYCLHMMYTCVYIVYQ